MDTGIESEASTTIVSDAGTGMDAAAGKTSCAIPLAIRSCVIRCVARSLNLVRECYVLQCVVPNSLASIKQTNATKCKPATVSGKRS